MWKSQKLFKCRGVFLCGGFSFGWCQLFFQQEAAQGCRAVPEPLSMGTVWSSLVCQQLEPLPEHASATARAMCARAEPCSGCSLHIRILKQNDYSMLLKKKR